VFQGTTNGNASILFNSTSNTWQSTANDLTTYATLLSTANVKSTYANESANVASLTAVKGANDNAIAAYASSNVAANTVRVSAQSASTIHNAQLNFINSASINVLVTTGVTGNANIAFTANSSNPALLGPQGIQGVQGTLGVQGSAGFVGSDGAQGAIGAQGSAGSNGTQGATGAQGIAGSNGSNGAQGAQGVTGNTGNTGNTGSQGAIGATGAGTQGAIGATGSTGSTGAAGPSNVISATLNAGGGPFYVIGISGTTPYYSTAHYRTSSTVYAGDFYASSDARLKTVLGFVDNAVEIVEQLNGVRYTWNDIATERGLVSDNNLTQLGLLAQEVQSVLPEAVNTSDDGYLSVSYDKLVPVLIEAIKELNARIKVLEAKE
jgi:hypothetical protein